MKNYIVVCLILIMRPQFADAWFAAQLRFDHIRWAPDSQSIIFDALCVADEGAGGSDMILQYHITTQRLLNLTPRIDWYMMSPSQKWLVFADYHGLYILELHQDGRPNGHPVQVYFDPFFEYRSRWILIGFSHNESSFLYGQDEHYYEVPLPATLTDDVHSFPHNEIGEDFSCDEYRTFARYYEERKGVTHRRGESQPITDKCPSDDSHVNTLFEQLETFDVNLVPDWALETQPQHPCVSHRSEQTESESHYAPYTIQFARGDEMSAYVTLKEYAEYLDSLGLRVTLEYHGDQQQQSLIWGNFMNYSTAQIAQTCLQQQFQLSTQIVVRDEHEYLTETVGAETLPSFGRVLSPDNTKTAYIKHIWTASFLEPMTEIWMIEHEQPYLYWESKVVDAITN